MADAVSIPHDRGHQLWSFEEGPTRKLLASIDRWVGAILADDGIEMPLMGGTNTVEAKIIARSDGIIAGTCVIDHMLQIWAFEIDISWQANDGKKVSKGDRIATLRGPKEAMLLMERSILNVLGHLSGIASEAKKWSTIAPRQIACTRKTIWGLLDKYAVHVGGGLSHRLDKMDAKMVKENDLAAMVELGDSQIARIVAYLQQVNMEETGSFLELEVQDAKEAITAAATWSARMKDEEVARLVVMLDNFGPEDCKSCAEELTEMGLREAVWLEASGGITLDTLPDWKEVGIDVISTSAINRGTTPLDVSLLFEQA